MNNERLSELRYKGHITDSEYKELKLAIKVLKARPKGKWIPVSERLPDNETEVLFQYMYGQSMRVGYHIHDSTIYPLGYEDENKTGWYDSEDNFICGDDEVIAWMSKPESYKENNYDTSDT